MKKKKSKMNSQFFSIEVPGLKHFKKKKTKILMGVMSDKCSRQSPPML